jgi:2-phosphoglycerate kinase
MDESGWTVALICGAAGVGKSSVARPLAHRWGVPVAEVDDVVTALQALTSAEQIPLLHYWDTHPEVGSWPAAKIAALHLSLAEALRPGFQAVIADHVDSGARVILEGDYLLPELTTGFGEEVRGVLVSEPDPRRIAANLQGRDRSNDQLKVRAEVSSLVEAALAQRVSGTGTTLLPARPWSTLTERADRVLSTAH